MDLSIIVKMKAEALSRQRNRRMSNNIGLCFNLSYEVIFLIPKRKSIISQN